ncbi:MAG: hypothetical protein AAB556_01020 [Patescibacteria group bacterium]
MAKPQKKEYKRQYGFVKGPLGLKSNTAIVLEELKGGALLTLELLDALLGAHQRSYKSALGITYKENTRKKSFYEVEREKQQVFYTLLNRMKRDGLISKKQSQKGTLWHRTEKGLKKLGLIQKKRKNRYSIIKEKKIKIVTFDIPEALKNKREWLRETLRFLEFRMLQKSVWIGTSAIPEDLLLDLRDGALMDYIHIFEIGSRGTIKEL